MELELFPASGDAQSSHLLVLGSEQFQKQSEQWARQLSSLYSLILYRGQLPGSHDVWNFSCELESALLRKKMRRGAVLGVENGASVAQGFAVSSPKFLRRLILCGATTRVAPSALMRAVDRLEKLLPLGLPLRKLKNDFDSRPMLHRIHAPTLIMVDPQSSSYLHAQGTVLAERIPNSWLRVERIFTSEFSFAPAAFDALKDFVQVPTKRPQKNISSPLQAAS